MAKKRRNGKRRDRLRLLDLLEDLSACGTAAAGTLDSERDDAYRRGQQLVGCKCKGIVFKAAAGKGLRPCSGCWLQLDGGRRAHSLSLERRPPGGSRLGDARVPLVQNGRLCSACGRLALYSVEGGPPFLSTSVSLRELLRRGARYVRLLRRRHRCNANSVPLHSAGARRRRWRR